MGIHAPEGVDGDQVDERQEALGGRPVIDEDRRLAALITVVDDGHIGVGNARLRVPDAATDAQAVAVHLRETLKQRLRERRPNATEDTWDQLETAAVAVADRRDAADPETVQLLRQAIDGL